MTAATVQDELDVFLDAVAYPASPSRIYARRAIVRAVEQAARAEDGLVHISTVRHHLPAWVSGPIIGATISALHSSGHLRATGAYRRNGDNASRNGAKPAPLFFLAVPIPAEWSETDKS